MSYYVVLLASICTFQFMINDLDWGEKLSQATTEDGRTPLHLAAEMGYEQ